MYDVVIPCHSKDYAKLPHCIERIKKYLNPQPELIYIIGNIPVDLPGCVFCHEEEVLDIDKRTINYRPGWIYQQLLKLGQNVTKNNHYLCVDADVFFNKHIDIYSQNNKPYLFFSNIHQNHKPYFNLLKDFNLCQEAGRTFICDFMMMDKTIVSELIGNVYELFNFINPKLCENYLLSEYELYGNHVYKNFHFYYDFSSLTASQYGSHNLKFTKELLEECSNQSKQSEVFAIHSWT